MKDFRDIVINLSLILLLIGVFPGLAFAHGNHKEAGTTAEQAEDGGEQDMKDFVEHAKAHLEEAVRVGNREEGIDRVVALRAEMREEGRWNHDSTYLIKIDKSGSVINHGKHTKTMYGDFIKRFPEVESLMMMLMLKENAGETVCVPNGADGDDSYSCATYYMSPFAQENILIGGFDHDVDDMRVDKLRCHDYQPLVTAEYLQKKQDDGADEDVLKENLKFLVKDAIRWVSMTPAPGMAEDPLEPDIISSVRCFTKGHDRSPWKFDSIYFFVITNELFVAVNGNNQELTGGLFIGVLDEDNQNIGQLIKDAAGEAGKGGFVRYLWDDPRTMDDNVVQKECHNYPDPCSPGTSLKISYVEGVNFSNFTGQEDTVFIFGSGIYPEKAEEKSNDGCAIAADPGNTPENTVFNLFMTVSGLLLALSWERRTRSGRKKEQHNII